MTVIPDEYVNPEPIPKAVHEVAMQWASPTTALDHDPVYNLYARKLPQFVNLSHRESEGILTRAASSIGHELDETCLDGKKILDSVVCAAANLAPGSYLPIQV